MKSPSLVAGSGQTLCIMDRYELQRAGCHTKLRQPEGSLGRKGASHKWIRISSHMISWQNSISQIPLYSACAVSKPVFLSPPSRCSGITNISEDSSEIWCLLVENYTTDHSCWISVRQGIFAKSLPFHHDCRLERGLGEERTHIQSRIAWSQVV